MQALPYNTLETPEHDRNLGQELDRWLFRSEKHLPLGEECVARLTRSGARPTSKTRNRVNCADPTTSTSRSGCIADARFSSPKRKSERGGIRAYAPVSAAKPDASIPATHAASSLSDVSPATPTAPSSPPA